MSNLYKKSPADIHTYYRDTLAPEDRRYPALTGTVQADICVVGGGLAGMNVALGLAERGRQPVVLEGRRIGWGASGRNGGFVAKGYAADPLKLAKAVGLPHAQELMGLTKSARNLIRARKDKYNIDCGPLTPGVLTVSWRDNPDAVQQTVDKMNEAFDLGFEFWGRDKVREHCRTERYFDGVFSPDDYQFHPLRYLHGIAAAVTDAGGQIYEDTTVTTVTRRPQGGWRIETAQGAVVEADILVMCASIYVGGVEKRLARSSFPVRTFVMVTDPLEKEDLQNSLNTKHAIYDMRFASDYYRVLPDRRIMWGGRVSIGDAPRNLAEVMRQDLLKVYPQLEGKVTADYAWSGDLCYAPHKMPQIGKFADDYWYATCYGGHGLAPTTVGGEAIAAAITGEDKRYELFKPFGLWYAGGPLGPYVAQSVYWWWRARDYLRL